MSKQLALDHLHRLVEETKLRGISMMVSMEESDKLPIILEVYQQVAEPPLTLVATALSAPSSGSPARCGSLKYA